MDCGLCSVSWLCLDGIVFKLRNGGIYCVICQRRSRRFLEIQKPRENKKEYDLQTAISLIPLLLREVIKNVHIMRLLYLNALIQVSVDMF